MTDTALVVGNFHVPRSADVEGLQRVLLRADRVVVVLGCAFAPRSPRNPLTWGERAAMLQGSLPAALAQRTVIEPLREWWDDDRTRREIEAIAQRHGARVPAAVDARTLQQDDPLRDLLWTAETPELALAAIEPQVPSAVSAAIAAFTRTPEYERMRAEWQQVAGEKAAWSVAPYPVVLVTVDAVVRAAGHVLLIRRGRAPGKGLAALPGGFLDPSETVLQGALRELMEETGIGWPQAQLLECLRGVRVFDHPRRSQRGRVVTHAHFFDLAQAATPPEVAGGDDAASAQWISIERLASLEDQLIDDHLHILDTFLNVLH